MSIKKEESGASMFKRGKKRALTYVQILLVLLIAAIIVVVAMPVLFNSKDFYKTKADDGSQWYIDQQKDYSISDTVFEIKDDMPPLSIELLDNLGKPLPVPVIYKTPPLKQGQQLVVIMKVKKL